MLLSCHRRQGNLHSTSECCERKALFATKETRVLCHFSATGSRKVTKRMPFKVERHSDFGFAKIFVILSPLKIPLSCVRERTSWWRLSWVFVDLISEKILRGGVRGAGYTGCRVYRVVYLPFVRLVQWLSLQTARGYLLLGKGIRGAISFMLLILYVY